MKTFKRYYSFRTVLFITAFFFVFSSASILSATEEFPETPAGKRAKELAAALQTQTSAQILNDNLKILEPLLNKTWTGELKSPDGSKSWKTVHEYKLLWDGTVVKFTGTTPDINATSEGYLYWDRAEQKIAVLIINNKGIYNKGFVTLEEGTITIKGTTSFPERTFEYKNTFEFTSDDKMINRWFQNAFGSWMAGHVIEFTSIRNE